MARCGGPHEPEVARDEPRAGVEHGRGMARKGAAQRLVRRLFGGGAPDERLRRGEEDRGGTHNP